MVRSPHAVAILRRRQPYCSGDLDLLYRNIPIAGGTTGSAITDVPQSLTFALPALAPSGDDFPAMKGQSDVAQHPEMDLTRHRRCSTDRPISRCRVASTDAARFCHAGRLTDGEGCPCRRSPADDLHCRRAPCTGTSYDGHIRQEVRDGHSQPVPQPRTLSRGAAAPHVGAGRGQGSRAGGFDHGRRPGADLPAPFPSGAEPGTQPAGAGRRAWRSRRHL